MTTPNVENVLPAPYAAPCGDPVLRATAAIEAAAGRFWQVLKTVGEKRARREMLLLARRSASTRPALAASLVEAARQSWAR